MKRILVFMILFSPCVNAMPQHIIIFPADSARFVLSAKIDSVFIFDQCLGVTAMGKDLGRLQYRNFGINGDSIPPNLKINNPVGAIMYSSEFSAMEIPIIIARQNRKMPLDRLLREYFFGLNEFKGQSEKGGIRIHVWQKKQEDISFLIFLKDGRIIGNCDRSANGELIKNFSPFNAQLIHEAIDEIVGVWIYPPEIGNNDVTGEILKLLQQGPLLVEYWDGLSWHLLEECFLSDTIKGWIDRAEIGYSMFPPVTETNYWAMISGGSIDMKNKMHLFDCLDSLRIPYQILEGEKMIIPVQGKVQLHTGQTPEAKDEKVYGSALKLIKPSFPALLFLHYHGLDDLAHSLGPYDPRSINHVRRLWQWHLSLRRSWNGNVLIISDHGSHAITPDDKFLKNRADEGTHGNFIFEDMAVPFIIDKGSGKTPVDFKLSSDQAKNIWELLGITKSLASDSQAWQSDALEIIFNGKINSFSAADVRLFHHEFQFNFTRKGAEYHGKFQGTELKTLLDKFDISSIRQIIAHSYDGHQVIFSKEDFIDNNLVIGLDAAKKQFALYPMKDKFPNRIVKQLQKIEID